MTANVLVLKSFYEKNIFKYIGVKTPLNANVVNEESMAKKTSKTADNRKSDEFNKGLHLY